MKGWDIQLTYKNNIHISVAIERYFLKKVLGQKCRISLTFQIPFKIPFSTFKIPFKILF